MAKRRDPDLPPHTRVELEQARLGIVTCVRALIAQGAPLPPVLLDAFAPLAKMEQDHRDYEQASRERSMAVPMHYVGGVGDKRTLCNLRADEAPHGWVGKDNEFYDRRLERGGAVCEQCRKMIET